MAAALEIKSLHAWYGESHCCTGLICMWAKAKW